MPKTHESPLRDDQAQSSPSEEDRIELTAPAAIAAAAVHAKKPGSGYFKAAVGFAVIGLTVPLLFGPLVFVLGLSARDRRHPKAWVPIILGTALTLYGLAYYRLATA